MASATAVVDDRIWWRSRRREADDPAGDPGFAVPARRMAQVRGGGGAGSRASASAARWTGCGCVGRSRARAGTAPWTRGCRHRRSRPAGPARTRRDARRGASRVSGVQVGPLTPSSRSSTSAARRAPTSPQRRPAWPSRRGRRTGPETCSIANRKHVRKQGLARMFQMVASPTGVRSGPIRVDHAPAPRRTPGRPPAGTDQASPGP